MKKFILCAMTCLALAGCDFFGGSNTGTEGETGTGVENILGCGYDLYDIYADPEYVKEPILDYGKLEAEGKITEVALDKSEFTSSSGSTYSEYSESLAVKASVSGSHGFFSGSLSTAFASDRFASSEYEYASVHADIKKKAYIVQDRSNLEHLKNYLDEDFATALNDPDYPVEDLFSRFGTHLMTGVILGARMDYNLSAKKTASSGSQSISSLAKARYKTAFTSASASLEVETGVTWEDHFSEEDIRTHVVGGSSEYGMNILTDNDYSAWIASIEERGVFSNYYADSLVPIQNLASDETRSQAITTGFEAWAEARKINTATVNPPRLAVIDIRAENANRGATLDANGRTYKQIGIDLNKGAGGKDIFLYVAFGMDNGSSGLEPINNVAIVYDGDADDAHEDVAADYTRVGQDLNQDAGGDYIYLVYHRGRANPIRGLYVKNESDGNNIAKVEAEIGKTYRYYECNRMLDKSMTYQRADLNKEAGGDDIFLFYGID